MYRQVLVGVCVGLVVMLATSLVFEEKRAALAKKPSSLTATLEETYSGWTRDQLLQELERRKGAALALKDTDDPELDRLVDEIEWLTARTGASGD